MTDNLLISEIIDDKEVVDYYGLFDIDVPFKRGNVFCASMENPEMLREFIQEFNVLVTPITNVDFMFTVQKFEQI